MTKRRFFYLWCLLVVAIFLPSFLPVNNAVYQVIAGYDSSRWAHFLAYVSVAAIPVAAWKRRPLILLSLLPEMISVAFQISRAHASGPFLRSQNVGADLFGLAAGILLGLNLRMIRKSGRSIENVSSVPSDLEIS